jgi:hypothetical protein
MLRQDSMAGAAPLPEASGGEGAARARGLGALLRAMRGREREERIGGEEGK